jgi:hypothetical protein
MVAPTVAGAVLWTCSAVSLRASASAATGAFATHNNYGHLSPVLRYIVIFFCPVSGICSTMLYFSVSHRLPRTLLKSAKCRFSLSGVLASAGFIPCESMWNERFSVRTGSPKCLVPRGVVHHLYGFASRRPWRMAPRRMRGLGDWYVLWERAQVLRVVDLSAYAWSCC